jgi:hypothetical protein
MIPPIPKVSAIVWRRPYFFGDLKVKNGPRFITSYLEHADHIVSTFKGSLSICGDLEIGMNLKAGHQLASYDLRSLQSFWVDIVKTEGGFCELRRAQDIPHEIFREDGASGADERDFGSS